MLTHELNNFTMSEAVKFYDQLKAAFKYLVPMGVAANISQPYVETNYSLPDFEQCRFPSFSCDDVTNARSRHCRYHDDLEWGRLCYGFIWPILWLLFIGLAAHQRGQPLVWYLGWSGRVGRIRG